MKTLIFMLKNGFFHRPHLLSAVLCLAIVTPALAGGEGISYHEPAAPGQPGHVHESSPGDGGPPTFDVYETDEGHNMIKPALVTGFPGVFNPVTGNYEATIPVLGVPNGHDVQNITHTPGQVAGGGGGGGGGVTAKSAVADLSIESLYLGTNGNVYIDGLFARLEQLLGPEGMLRIPDLFTAEVEPDTNGVFTLYSLVDINQFPLTPLAWNFGDDMQITNGECALLPGMLFSSTPFVFTGLTNGPPEDPFTGWGFTGTAFNGDALILTDHGLGWGWDIPEPSPFALLGAGAVSLLAHEWRRRKAKA